MSKKFGMQVIFGSSNLSPNNGPFLAVLHCPCSPGPYKIKLFFSPTRGAAVKFKPKRGKGIDIPWAAIRSNASIYKSYIKSSYLVYLA